MDDSWNFKGYSSHFIGKKSMHAFILNISVQSRDKVIKKLSSEPPVMLTIKLVYSKAWKEGLLCQYKVFLGDHLYPVMRHLYPDGNGLFEHPQVSSGLWMVWWVWKWCESYAKAFTVTNSQHSRTPVTNALLHYHQNIKLGNLFWKNGVSSLYYITETQRINKSVPCHIFTARWPFSKDYSAEMQVRTQKSNPVVSNINLPAPEYEVDVMFDCIGVRKTKVIVLVNSQLVSGCLLSPASCTL